MKTAVFLFFSLSCSIGFAQVFGGGKIDSVTKLQSFTRFYISPSGLGGCMKEEYALDRKRLIVFLSCDDSTELEWEPVEIPDACMAVYKKSYAAKKDYTLANKHFRSCIDDYYGKPENRQKVDTIYMERNAPFLIDPPGAHPHEKYFLNNVSIYDSLELHKYAKFYYTIDEVKNHCLTGINFRTKRMEAWENGQKHGEWEYYDPSGNLICKERYYRGILEHKTCP